MKLTEAVAKRLEGILNDRQLKQSYLFKNGGIPRATVSVILGAKRKTIKLDTIYQICDTLKMTLKEFFDNPIFEEVTD